MLGKCTHKAYEIFHPMPSGWNVKKYYESDLNPYQHMSVDDDPPTGTDELVQALAELQEFDINDAGETAIARRHCAFFIRIVKFKYDPHTDVEWQEAVRKFAETGYIGDETKNAYIQAYYDYILAHPELGRWDYLDQMVDQGARTNFWIMNWLFGIRPQLFEVLANGEK